MGFKPGDTAVSLRGHDRGGPYFVLAARAGRVTVADGRRKKPKEKNPKHLRAVSVPAHPTAEKLARGEQVSGRELRSALAALRDQIGGHDAWQRTI